MGEARDRQAEGAGTPHRRRRWRASRSRRRKPSARSRRAPTSARPSRSAAPRRQDQARAARGFPDHRARHRRTIRARDASSRCASKRACACACRDVREPARVRRKLGNGRLEVEAGFMKMQVSDRRRDRSAAGDRRPGGPRQLTSEERHLPPGAGAGARPPGDQRDRPARRRSPRRRRRISGPRRDGHRQPRPHRPRPRHGHPARKPSRSC